MYVSLEKLNWFNCHLNSLWFYRFIDSQTTKKQYIDMGFVKARNVALGVYFAEFVCCLFRLGLYSVRRFVISIIINVVFLILTVIGGYGTLIINPYFVIIHWGGVLIAYVIFLIMILATLGTGSGDGNGEIFAYYIPLLIEPIPLALLLYFNWIICRFQINYEKLEKVRIEAEREDIINVIY